MTVGSGPVVPKIGFKNNRCLKDYLDWVALPKVNAEDRPKAFVCVGRSCEVCKSSKNLRVISI